MAKEIKLPYFGETDVIWVGIFGGGTVLLIGAIWWRHMAKQNASKKQQQPQSVYVAGQTGIDPAGTRGVIDPETGYVYGSDEDRERLGELAIENYASVVYYPNQGVPDVHREHGRDNDKDKDRKPDRKANNQLWLQTSIQGLSEEYEQASLTNALTKALAGANINVNERQMFMAAIHFQGEPPEGYPPLRLTDTDAQPEPKPQSANVSSDTFAWGM